MFGRCCCEQQPESAQVAFRPVDDQNAYGHPQDTGDIVHKSFGATADDQEDDAAKDADKGAGTKDEMANDTVVKAADLIPQAEPKDAGGAAPVSEANIAAGVEREKGRLQELVKAFLKRAVKGIECEIVDPATGARRAAAYYVDRRLRELTVKATEKAGEAPAFDQTFQMGTVTILQNQAASRELEPAAQTALGATEASPRLLVVVCDDQKLFIQESTAEDADNFAICMRVLRVYCRQLSAA